MAEYLPRTGVERAKSFLSFADNCDSSRKGRDRHEAFLEASLIFCRLGVQRFGEKMKDTHGKNPRWKKWWASLLENKDLEFLRDERNWIVHVAPPKIGQTVYLAEQPKMAKDFYFYERNENGIGVPAVDTIRRLIGTTEVVLDEGSTLFGSDGSSS